ncbi:putative cytidylyltransferase-like [Lyophyllum shimeji]|uniref:Cytidylyltransferase-like n=1 Tax=Lyophyllum shimeji TaxID=47721 RepID=A0A9P3PF35_LYOSH|nr:putative cytidylyltransferase-like [Lyophyllum shimeji]
MYNHNRSPSPFPPSETAERALLLATIPSLDPPHFLGPIIANAATTTRDHLTIVLFSRLFNDPCSSSTTFRGVSRTEHFDDVLHLLTYVYVQATSVAQSLDKILMEIDVLLLGIDHDVPCDLGKGVNVVFRVAGDAIAVPLPASITTVRQSFLQPADHDPIDALASPSTPLTPSTPHDTTHKPPPRLPVVALGGTFDHLHAGHKILLSMGAWIASEKIIVGVTDDVLLTKKINRHVMQPLPERIECVRAFLARFRPGIEYEIVPIQDVCGPTGWDPNVQGLVVSRETVSGAEAIATQRAAKSLPPLQTFIIDVISPDSARLDHEDMDLMRRTKMSSTFIREWLANKKAAEQVKAKTKTEETTGGREAGKV